MLSYFVDKMHSGKKTVSPIEGEKVVLRELTETDVTQRYVSWMNDPEINQYLESRFQQHTLEDLKCFVKRIIADPNSYLYAIIEKENLIHIGNIKLGPIVPNHRRASIGIIIGEKEFLRKGAGTEAIHLLARFAFNILKINKLTAGCYAPNWGSMKVFENNGFKKEGVRAQHCLLNGEYVDVIELGLINPYEKPNA